MSRVPATARRESRTDFRLQTPRRLPPEQAIVVIDSAAVFVGLRALRVDGAGNNQLMNVLKAPIMCHQFARQPVEQLRVGRLLALEAEVAGRAHQTLAEMVLPEPIDDDASQQMAGALVDVGDPGGQGFAAVGGAPTGRRSRLPVFFDLRAARQHLREALRGDAVLLVGVAALEEVGLVEEVGALRVQPQGRQTFAADEGLESRRLGSGLLMLVGLLAQGLPAGVLGAEPGQ